MTQRNSAFQTLDAIADIAKSLANRNRLHLLDCLMSGEMTVDNLALLTDLSIANASQHLQHLKRSNLVQSRREGTYVYYRLGDGPVVAMLDALKKLDSHNRAQIVDLATRSTGQIADIDPMTREELIEQMRLGGIVLLDVRPSTEYSEGHLPGAINIPLDELEQRLADLPSDQTIVAYCRGPFCLLSSDAVALLRKTGRPARQLAIGYPQWSSSGAAAAT